VDAVSEAVQGGERVRLIDADALPIVTRGKNHHRQYVFADITDAPTIDAIPLDWLREKMRGYASALKSTELSAVVTVMSMWEKEQEAQDE
jgi:hypothetical protein